VVAVLVSCRAGAPEVVVERPEVRAVASRAVSTASGLVVPAGPVGSSGLKAGAPAMPRWSPLAVTCAAAVPATREQEPGAPRYDALRTGVTTELVGLWGSGPRDIWMIGGEGTILRTRDGGATFSRCEVPGAPELVTIWGSGPDDVWIVSRERVFHATRGGEQWSQLGAGEAQSFSGGWGTSAKDVWLMGSPLPDVWALRTTDGGATWTAIPSKRPMYGGLWGTSASDLWVDSCFFVSRSVDGGVTWGDSGFQPEGEEGFVIRGSGSEDVWIVGSEGTLLFSANHGKTWRGEGFGWRYHGDLWSAGHGFAWVAGAGISARLGKVPWVNEVDREVSLRGVWGSSRKDIWAVGAGGLVLHRR
jgi:hypothetical protein